MPDGESRILIVGSDGVLGKALMNHLQRAGQCVAGTTRRRENTGESRLYLDLSQDVSEWRPPWPVGVAVICAGATSVEGCRHDPNASERVNVMGTGDLSGNLMSTGTFVIFLSTNQVFDGSVPHRMEEDPLSPVTEYGRQKARTENLIRKWGDCAAIVRFAKILGPQTPLFAGWLTALQKGEAIHPFSDMYLAPVPLSCAVSVLRLVIDRRFSGVLQVSGDRDVSYADTAVAAARLWGATADLVQPVKAGTMECFRTGLPAHTTLNMDRLKSRLGIVPPDVGWTIETALTSPELLAGY
jgi:dTDP-4-dehydrorhamnose reductase